ncbi:restriction endonuclease subunit S [Citrobacter sp. BDA59-3]|uniref:restriction endonuclease subunit S n=1 Tax=Citrobacter sp. BDA59-3 TaxID=2781952 RepID=UPI001881232F|nr:restriction endonuclease subunit S [Citrobacter sp. BDA59-3]QOV70857.1 restriction endonuclease subunit S [Citrobacter sp. BDA59-3]
MSWPMVKIGELGTVYSGGTPSRSNSSYWGRGIKWLAISDYSDFSLVQETKEQITLEGLNNSSAKIFDEGTVIISIFATLGRVAILGDKMATNQAIAGIKCNDSVNNRFLMYSLKSKLKEITDKSEGVAQKNINLNILKNLQVQLPPLNIQEGIVDMLDRVFLSLNQSRKIENELNALAQAVYESSVGISAKEHSNWSSYTISELCDTSKNSMRTGPFGSDLKHSEFVSAGVAVIGIDNAVSNEFRWVERRFITKQKYEKLKRYTVLPHDVIITIMGTTGRVAVIPADIPLAISTKHLAVLTLDKNKANPYFIADTLKWNTHVIEQIKRSNKGAIMDGLNLGTIKSLDIVLPPKEIQDEYVLKAKAIQDRIAEAKELSLTLELQFNALMQRAFSGKLDLKKVA